MPKLNPREIPQSLRGFGGRLRAARKSAGVTLLQLAEDIGTAASVLSRAETETRLPTLTETVRIAEALGVRPGWLISGEPPRSGQLVTILIQDDSATAASVRRQLSGELAERVPPAGANGRKLRHRAD